jgi:hypothetical protein
VLSGNGAARQGGNDARIEAEGPINRLPAHWTGGGSHRLPRRGELRRGRRTGRVGERHPAIRLGQFRLAVEPRGLGGRAARRHPRPDQERPAYPFRTNADGNRAGTGATKRITNTKDPVLKPWAAAQIEATNDEVLKGVRDIPFTAQSRCYPGGVPGQLLWPFEPVYFIQTPKVVWMIWQRDHLVRRIDLTDQHSERVTPSWFGESIGHYENGDTLVIDTIGLSTKNSYIDNFRTPHSEKLHVVEHFTLQPGGKGMSAVVTVDDPDTFNAPLTMTRRWFRFDGPMLETVCAENNVDVFHQNLFPQPEAKTSDF